MGKHSSSSKPAKAKGENQPEAKAADKAPSLLRSSAIVSLMTLFSRVLGLVRDVVVAQYFGAAADAFFVAFKIPNFLRRLFAEGAFAVAFVPVLSEYKTKRSFDEVRMLVAHTSGILGLALFAVTLLAIVFADYLPWIFAPGFREDPVKFALTGDLISITFPYLMFVSLTAFCGSVLNAYGRFAVPAFTPVILNLCMIGFTVFATSYFVEPLFALAWGVFFAGLLQFLFQLPFIAQLRLLVWPKAQMSEGTRRIIKLMIPALFGVSVSQINLLLDTLLASFLAPGSVSWLYYSDRLNNLPLGLFAIAIGVVILPSLSAKHAENNPQAFSRTLNWALRLVLILAVPAALALVFLATPLLTTIFYYGEMRKFDIEQMSYSLQAYGVGLMAFMLIKILAPGFYARQDTKTPVKVGIWAMAVNMLLNLALVFPLAHAGLALATSLSSFFNAFMLLWLLYKAEVFKIEAGWLKFLLKLVFANLVMLACVLLVVGSSMQWFDYSTSERVMMMSLVIATGLGSYALVWLGLGLRVKHLRGELF